jgi:hypothetical protein
VVWKEEVHFLDTMILINIGTLFVGVVTLIVALLALRSARRARGGPANWPTSARSTT